MIRQKENLFQGGSKLQLAKRILKAEDNEESPNLFREEVSSYLEPKGRSLEKPRIIADYGNSFNSVDRLNKIRSYISYRPKIKSIHFRVLVAFVEIALTQAWALTIDWNGETLREEDNILVLARTIAQTLNNP